MFREAMSKGKTRVTIEISDCNLLRMRLLMLLERPKRNDRYLLGDFLDRYFEQTVDKFLEDLNGGSCCPANPYDQVIAMLNELQPEFSEKQYLEFDIWGELPKKAKDNYDQLLEENEEIYNLVENRLDKLERAEVRRSLAEYEA